MGCRIALFPMAALIAAAAGDLPDLAPRVRSVSPMGGRTGETVPVRISGSRLDGPVEIAFARPDIGVEVLSSDASGIKARISVGARVPAGLHDYRLRTPRGSFLGVFHVAALPATAEVEPNDAPAAAQPVALPAILDGASGSGDYDLFRFHARAGETLVFDLLARRAGSTLDAALAILDERGNELDFIDDYYIHKDPYLSFTAKRAGDYFVRVSAEGERGSGGNPYRLVAGPVPHVLRVLPAGVRRGSVTTFRIEGFNLDKVDRLVLGDALAEAAIVGSSPEALTCRMETPASAPAGPHPLRMFSRGVEAGLPATLLISDLDERLAAPARTRARPQPASVPGAFTGVLDQRRSTHFYAFEAKAGERLVFEVDAMKLGYLVDPVVAVYSEAGLLVASDDDRLQQNGGEPPNLDPYLVHTFEKAGRYIAAIRDMAQRGSPDYVYRLAIYPASPDFDVKGLTPGVTLYRGQTVHLPVRVRRHGGWETPVEVWVENLPPGMTTEKRIAEPKPTIVKDNCALDRRLDGTNVALPVQVSAGAAAGSYPIRVRARGTYNGRTVEHTAEVLYKWESVGKVTGPTADQTLVATVADLPPVLLEAPETLTLTPGRPARLRVLVTRFDGAGTPLALEPEPAIPGVRFDNNVVPPGAAQVELRVTASGPVTASNFRLRAGSGLSQPIALKSGGSAQEEAR